jgi:hypothetical protein
MQGEVMGGWRKLHNDLHNLYLSPNIIGMIISQMIRWGGHVAHMGALEMQSEDPKGSDHLEVLGIDERVLE